MDSGVALGEGAVGVGTPALGDGAEVTVDYIGFQGVSRWIVRPAGSVREGWTNS